MIVFISILSVISTIFEVVAKYFFAENGIWFSNIIYIPDTVAYEYRETFSVKM